MTDSRIYAPQPKFAVPRSYIRGIAINFSEPFHIEHVGSTTIHTIYDGGFDVEAWVTVWLNFYAWSSNVYTLDHVFTEGYYIINHDGVHRDASVQVAYIDDPAGTGSYIEYAYLPGGGRKFFDLPPADPGYWLYGGGH